MPVSKEKWDALSKRMQSLGIQEDELIESFILGSGRGGQKIQKTHSCVSLRHPPTGLGVRCQKTRLRADNRYHARARLCEKLEELLYEEKSKIKQQQEKIRRQKKRRSRKSKLKMLQDKRLHSEKKQLRQSPKDD
ncbi:MAG: peptide chain release factor-like protein [Chlamydiia bacterium]|nr:peptide chain release factor-like protein [Chlamydiia bacterium]